jgi:hypothetical protein
MKKIFILLLAVVALLAFTIPAFALHAVKEQLDYTPSVVKAKNAQVDLWGHFRIRGSYADNTSDFQDTDENGTTTCGTCNDDSAAYDQRLRFGVAATVSPNTKAAFELETNSGSSDGFSWGANQGGGGVYEGAGNSKPTDMHIRQAYIQHQGTELTGSLSGFKAGHMLMMLGNGTYYNHTSSGDDAIVLWTQIGDNTEVNFAIIKGDENSAGGINSNDTDIYALTVETNAGGAAISGDISLLSDDTTFGADADLWNLGLRAGLDLSGVGVNVGCDFQSGQIENFKTGGSDMDLSGYQCQIKANTKVGDIDVHGGFAYGSGDDIDSADDYEGFVTSLSAGGNVGTFVYDNTIQTAAQNTLSAAAGASSTYAGADSTNGLANTWYLNVGATTNVTPDVAINAELFYLQASEKVSNTTGLDDEDIGVELDGKITYQIDTALAWYVESGILFSGDFYKNVTGATVSPDSTWRVRQGIVLNF